MLLLPNTALPAAAGRKLSGWQAEIDAELSFGDKVESAKTQFKQKNTKQNTVFKVVRQCLKTMHGDLVRCAYCEDSVADEVEHISPKDVYPDKVFSWDNYTYACGPCNGPKNNRFAIFRRTDGREVDITPPRPKPQGWQPTPPPPGDPLLINPRVENPMDYLWLDLMGTFRLDPHQALGSRERRRAEYTRDLLDLNRDFLLKSRHRMFVSMRSLLMEYVMEKEGRDRAARKMEIRFSITNSFHRTVWAEIVRQRNLPSPLHVELKDLFDRAPEVLNWM